VKKVGRKEFRAVRKTRVSEDIIEQVRDLIASGRFNPGDRLPSERELAQALSVSRSAVREAIRAMESLGLIEARAGEGTFVAAPTGTSRRDPISASLFQAWSTQHKLFEVRRLIEPGLAALAARRATTEQIANMAAVLAEQKAEIRRGGTGIKENSEFHLLIARATGNEVLVRIMGGLRDLLRKTREASWRGGDPSVRSLRSLKHHQRILRAIEARDPAVAERRMRDHIHEVEELVFATRDGSVSELALSRPSSKLGVAL
jgi:GntR family transcriptional repressor for pyruvate dehydrogenase complex